MHGLRSAVLVLLVTAIACSHGNPSPQPLTLPNPSATGLRGSTKAEYDYRSLSPGVGNTDSLFVAVTFSGGGTRAAALAYGVLQELNRTQVEWESYRKPLLAEVDVLSSVSGGSFTAAYYASHKASFFDDFPRAVLNWNLQRQLIKSITSPSILRKYHDIKYSRIDYAAELYAERLFKSTNRDGTRFGELHERPYLIINATDMTQGTLFSFTDEQFMVMCRQIGDYPLARAVAASSAFPLLLAPLTVENYAGYCRDDRPQLLRESWDVCRYARVTDTKYDNYCDQIRTLASYRNAATRPFVHLLDGGIADNVGVQPLIRMLSDSRASPPVLLLLNEQAAAGKRPLAVAIVVNAKTGGRSQLDESAATPDFRATLSVAQARQWRTSRTSQYEHSLTKSAVKRWSQALCAWTMRSNRNANPRRRVIERSLLR